MATPVALPGQASSSPPASSQAGGVSQGFLRVVSPAQLDQQDQEEQERQARLTRRRQGAGDMPDIGSWIRQQWMVFRNHKNLGQNAPNLRLLRSQRMFESKYDPEKLAQITAFGGSEVYANTIATKCRGATSLLRDVYLNPDERSWGIDPEPDPPVPDSVTGAIKQLLQTEVSTLQANGEPVNPDQIHLRFIGLMHSAQQAARRNAQNQADAAADKINDILVQGRFYEALGEFLMDLPLFPYACLKGPVVRMVPRLVWLGTTPNMQNVPTMFWERVNPFDIYWSPGAASIEDAEIIQRLRFTRADLNDLLGLPGYDQGAIYACLEDYANGLREWLDAPDAEEALNQNREDPNLNRSKYIEGIEYHGCMQGQHLLELGIHPDKIADPRRDYMVQSWVVGRHTLKTAINPSPRMRHPYYLTSFEKVPGSVMGHGLPDICEDLQEVANAAFRSLVNNLSLSSGPQVVINDEMISPTEHGDELYPWKRWHVQGDPFGNQNKPVDFFQPNSNVQELLLVISTVNTMADERSAIPRYLTGESLSGGAGRTSSGLAMLMNNAEKVLQFVCANIDGDVIKPAIQYMYDMVMLTDRTGLLTGQEEIRVEGSQATIQKETQRQRQLQFLQLTGNPIDMQIVGLVGRARVLRAIADDLDLGDDIVPDDDTLQQRLEAQSQAQNALQAVQSHAGPAGVPPPPGGPGGQPGQGQQGGQSQAVGSPPGSPAGLNAQTPAMPQGPMTNTVQPPGPPMGGGG